MGEPLPWKVTGSELRALAALGDRERDWIDRTIEGRRNFPGLACSVCPQPAVLVRVRIIGPPQAQELGAGPGLSNFSVCQFCEGHNKRAGFIEFDRIMLERHRRGTSANLADGTVAYD
jgi:hypothetical protein